MTLSELWQVQFKAYLSFLSLSLYHSLFLFLSLYLSLTGSLSIPFSVYLLCLCCLSAFIPFSSFISPSLPLLLLPRLSPSHSSFYSLLFMLSSFCLTSLPFIFTYLYFIPPFIIMWIVYWPRWYFFRISLFSLLPTISRLSVFQVLKTA